jgi:hypothetical protein
MPKSDALRKHLLELLKGGGAHTDFDSAVARFPVAKAGDTPSGAPHSAWQLLEHLRIAQWDILEFSRDPKHVSPKWPEGYWPESASPPAKTAWSQSVRSFRSDLKSMMDLVADPANDLTAPIPHGDGQTLLREALLVADHNAYHIGQLLFLRQLLGVWKK